MQNKTNTAAAAAELPDTQWMKWAGRAGAVLLAIAYVLLVAQVGAAHADPLNPFTDVKPDPGLFGGAFNTVWKRLLGAAWAFALIMLGGQAVVALIKRSRAARQGASADLAESTEDFRDALIRFGLASGISVVLGAVLFAVNAS